MEPLFTGPALKITDMTYAEESQNQGLLTSQRSDG